MPEPAFRNWLMANGENPQVVRAMLRWTNLNMLAHAWKWIGSPVIRWSCNRAWALNSAVECHLRTLAIHPPAVDSKQVR